MNPKEVNVYHCSQNSCGMSNYQYKPFTVSGAECQNLEALGTIFIYWSSTASPYCCWMRGKGFALYFKDFDSPQENHDHPLQII